MHYSNGNYEAFINAEKPKDVDNKSAYIVGSGLAALAAAVFLIRDGHMKGDKIHVLEELALPGGSMDAIYNVADQAYVMRGGREMEPHFETLWDLFRSIPSLDYPDQSVLDEFYRENRKDPCYSKTRVIENRGQELPTDGDLLLSPKAVKEILNLVMTPEKDLQDKKINEVFDDEFFKSNFWLYWQTMFAFMPWASAMEMRRYLMRFVQHVATLKNLSSLRFTKYNQYEDLIMPLISYLKKHGVKFHYDTIVDNIIVNRTEDEKVATEIKMTEKGEPKVIKLTPNDLVFVTNGSITESTTYGDNTHPAEQKHELGPSWQLWKNLAAQDEDFGHPEKFCENIPAANWVISATVTFTNDDIVPYIEKVNKKDPHSGSIVTSGPTTIKDSNWLLGYSISRQPPFHKQKPNELIVWLYGLYSNTKGNYVKKTMPECDGIELCEEWLYHMGVPESEIKKMAIDATTIPNHMPYITSYFMPRALGDRPKVVPKNSKNLAFIGNFAETERDTVFTTEYSVRTAMEAVYTLLNVDRGVPEVFASAFDVRMLMNAMYYLNDRKKLTELDLPLPEKLMVKEGLKKFKGTYVEELLKKYKLI
ncbi:oleate hydratase [Lactobacillus gasseri]|nr:oleate hydratase [Lactobacillus gasseri]MCZ3583466.1 oleate hydratase [Lactobacillus gasseri]MCZ3585274.1 oleate hydratase [Lactobacillus gasseri]MCZ3588912.1 oleate hydratase [Lactobacillus gasseri]MCZ3594626.1 oleate hydratase [Lactobacillus gasseri]